jgi:hypothetical protein
VQAGANHQMQFCLGTSGHPIDMSKHKYSGAFLVQAGANHQMQFCLGTSGHPIDMSKHNHNLMKVKFYEDGGLLWGHMPLTSYVVFTLLQNTLIFGTWLCFLLQE